MARKQMDYFARKEAEEKARINAALARIKYISDKIPNDIRPCDLGSDHKVLMPVVEFARFHSLYANMTEPEIELAYQQMYAKMSKFLYRLFLLADIEHEQYEDIDMALNLLDLYNIAVREKINVRLGKSITAKLMVAKLKRA